LTKKDTEKPAPEYAKTKDGVESTYRVRRARREDFHRAEHADEHKKTSEASRLRKFRGGEPALSL